MSPGAGVQPVCGVPPITGGAVPVGKGEGGVVSPGKTGRVDAGGAVAVGAMVGAVDEGDGDGFGATGALHATTASPHVKQLMAKVTSRTRFIATLRSAAGPLVLVCGRSNAPHPSPTAGTAIQRH